MISVPTISLTLIIDATLISGDLQPSCTVDT